MATMRNILNRIFMRLRNFDKRLLLNVHTKITKNIWESFTDGGRKAVAGDGRRLIG